MVLFYDFISVLLLIIICCIPIVFWGYFFSFHAETKTRSKFLFGIFAGCMSTLPILGMESIYTHILPILNIFAYLYDLGDFTSYTGLITSLLFLILCMGLFFLLVRSIFYRKNIELGSYIKATGFYMMGVFMLVVLFFLLSSFEGILLRGNASFVDNAPIFMGYVFQSIKLMILYYAVIAFLEEGTKYFAFLSGVDFSQFTGKSGIIFSLYVALGFAFFENILYAFSIFLEKRLTLGLVSIIFYRSIFSLFVHVFASVVLGYFFSKMYCGKNRSCAVIGKYICLGVLGAVFIHASFDIVVTLGWTFFIFLYFIGGYVYVSKLIFSNN